MLTIQDLTVCVGDKSILENFNLTIKPGEIHALMGQNGAGKSTISKVLLRDSAYKVEKGSILYNQEDLLAMTTTEVALNGMFMVSQNPIEIEGVSNAEMIRTALTDAGKNNMNILEFNRKMTSLCEKLNIPSSFIHRDINYHMSGGEKKKNELLHMWMLEPKFIILDEIDSGLDVDSLKLVANSILEYYEAFHPSILIITHQKSLLEILKPDYVHVLSNKHIVRTGDYQLAQDIFNYGFSGAGIMVESDANE